MDPAAAEQTALFPALFKMPDRVAGFIAHLRLNDFSVGPAETETALRLLSGCGLNDATAVRRRLKILLSGNRQEWEAFDALFEAFWLARGRERRRFKSAGKINPNPNAPALPQFWRRHLGHNQGGDKPIPHFENARGDAAAAAAAGRLIASSTSLSSRTDLRYVADPQAIAAAEQLAWRLAKAISYRLSRRYRIDPGARRLDLRRTIRANMSRGGEPINLLWRAPPQRPVNLVVLLDVSGSMKPYSRFFLQFVKGLVSQWRETEAFLFHTRLLRVTSALREKDALAAMTRLALMASGFGGGTKLGDCLYTFNKAYAKHLLNSRSVFIILSDGYDTGTPQQLGRQLAQLKRRVRRLVWLNPLLGWRHYAPVTAAMSAALPFIDHFAAANTLASLAAIEPQLARMR